MRLIKNFLVEKKPDSIELRAYLTQFIGFIDKRDFIPLSIEIQEYIETTYELESDIFDFIFNQCDDQVISSVLEKFNIFPEKVYFFLMDRNTYTTFYFDNLSLNNSDILQFNELEDMNEPIEDESYEEDYDSQMTFHPSDFPKLYSKVSGLLVGMREILIMELIPDECYEIYDENGSNVTDQLWQLYVEIENSTSHKNLECRRFNSVRIGANNELLITTGGRYDNWLYFSVQPDGFLLIDWDVDFGGPFKKEPVQFKDVISSDEIERLLS
jgi:hypothetical protein